MSVSDREREIFRRVAEEEKGAGGEGEFNTVNEKRLHRVLKRFVLERELGSDDSLKAVREGGFEVRIGRYVADLLLGGVVYEVQTKALKPLCAKIGYYLENTDYLINIVVPIKKETHILRVDKENGELLYKRRSPKREGVLDVLERFVGVGSLLLDSRVSVSLVEMTLSEQRYSERVRGRRSGAIESELFPEELVSLSVLSGGEDYLALIPCELVEKGSFTASDFSSVTHLKRYKLSRTLIFLCELGILCREKEGNKYVYSLKKKDS